MEISHPLLRKIRILSSLVKKLKLADGPAFHATARAIYFMEEKLVPDYPWGHKKAWGSGAYGWRSGGTITQGGQSGKEDTSERTEHALAAPLGELRLFANLEWIIIGLVVWWDDTAGELAAFDRFRNVSMCIQLHDDYEYMQDDLRSRIMDADEMRSPTLVIHNSMMSGGVFVPPNVPNLVYYLWHNSDGSRDDAEEVQEWVDIVFLDS
ncbi:hypothetical protein IAT38_007434 [Cryptococcus sp. DSM 104549]